MRGDFLYNSVMSHGVRLVLPILAFWLIIGLTTPAEAADEISHTCPICQFTTNHSSYGQKVGGTLLRGATNTVFGWTEILLAPHEEVKSGGNIASGIGKGMSLAVQRTAAGLGELLTFWTPKGKDGYLRFTTNCPICLGQQSPSSAPPASSSPATTR